MIELIEELIETCFVSHDQFLLYIIIALRLTNTRFIRAIRHTLILSIDCGYLECHSLALFFISHSLSLSLPAARIIDDTSRRFLLYI